MGNLLKIERIYKKDERLSRFVRTQFVRIQKILLTNTENNFKNDKNFVTEPSDED